MPHLGINYIILKQGKKSYDCFPLFVSINLHYSKEWQYLILVTQLMDLLKNPPKYIQVDIFVQMQDFY